MSAGSADPLVRTTAEIRLKVERTLKRHSRALYGAGTLIWGGVWYFRDISDIDPVAAGPGRRSALSHRFPDHPRCHRHHLDQEGRYLDVNRAFVEMSGYRPTRIIGRHLAPELNIWDDPEGRKRFVRRLPAAEAAQLRGALSALAAACSPGSSRSPHAAGRQALPAVASITRDITAQKLAEEELAAYHKHLEALVGITAELSTAKDAAEAVV